MEIDAIVNTTNEGMIGYNGVAFAIALQLDLDKTQDLLASAGLTLSKSFFLIMRNRGVKEGNTLYVLRRTKMPALLIELGFLSNESDAYKLRTNPEGFAYAIYQGILEYLF